jgi:Family of unknown function (DUF6788)
MSTVNPSLPELEARRAELYARLAEVGDFRRGSISQNYRRCGKPNCACAAAEHPGHGPRQLWTRRGSGGKTVGRQLAAGEVDKVRRELDAHRDFAQLSEKIVAVNEAICEARPVAPLAEARGEDIAAGTDGQKGGSSRRSPKRSRPR